jgi:hypothetical protein
MGGGFPKRSWPSREWAEDVLGRQHDRDILRVFECPVQPGFWHLGHVGRQTASPTGTKKNLLAAFHPAHTLRLHLKLEEMHDCVPTRPLDAH